MDLATYKQKHALTLTQLASKLGFAVSTVHGWIEPESGRRPSIAALSKIAINTGGEVTAADLRPDLAASFREVA